MGIGGTQQHPWLVERGRPNCSLVAVWATARASDPAHTPACNPANAVRLAASTAPYAVAAVTLFAPVPAPVFVPVRPAGPSRSPGARSKVSRAADHGAVVSTGVTATPGSAIRTIHSTRSASATSTEVASRSHGT